MRSDNSVDKFMFSGDKFMSTKKKDDSDFDQIGLKTSRKIVHDVRHTVIEILPETD